MRRWILASLLAGASLGGATMGSAATALPYSRNIRLVAPADGATITYASEDEVVAFSFHVDSLGVLADDARASGRPDTCRTKIDFYATCDGPACRSGPSGLLSRDNQDAVSLKVSALLALTANPSESRHSFVWGAELRDVENRNASPPCVSIALAATAARLTLEKKAGPPALALSVDPDAPQVWPKSVVVTDSGGPSQATFLVVTVKTLAASDAVVARYCALMDGSKTHTVEALPGGGSKRTFEVPALKPSKAQMDALLKSVSPASPPTPAPAKTPQKAMVAPGVTYRDPNVHQMVTCQYQLDAKLGSDTNAADPNKRNNAVSRTIRIDVPLN